MTEQLPESATVADKAGTCQQSANLFAVSWTESEVSLRNMKIANVSIWLTLLSIELAIEHFTHDRPITLIRSIYNHDLHLPLLISVYGLSFACVNVALLWPIRKLGDLSVLFFTMFLAATAAVPFCVILLLTYSGRWP